MSLRTVLLVTTAWIACTFAPMAQGYGNSYQDDVEILDEAICESKKGRVTYCDIDIRGEVVLTEQYSRSACVEGSSWGVDRQGLWVSNGCRGAFATVRQFQQRQRGRNQNYDRGGELVICESYDKQTNYCPIPRGSRARLYNQLSRSSCNEGYSWGIDRRGIWVSNGCRAEFEIY